MHAVKLLQKKIEKSCPNINKQRAQCLFDVVLSLVDWGRLWISALGRSVANQKSPKHNIKKVDCLVGNKKLHKERNCLYSYVASTWIGTLKRPVIIIDWSPVATDCKHHYLRASVTGIGRAMSLYEEVHAKKYYANNTWGSPNKTDEKI